MYTCINCKRDVKEEGDIGTKNRNHCPFCLHSKHLDLNTPGDRNSSCGGDMKPVGLTFKKGRVDKYNKFVQGEVMIVHKCTKCNKIGTNRIAADDDSDALLKVFEFSKNLKIKGIKTLSKEDERELKRQILGQE